jgi:structural maintenance of chromosome 3 (chondroitin sulfate proteoglycan 6)
MERQDTGRGLTAVDNIAGRHGLRGVYGPLYRLFEVTDQNFNTAVELTAGNRHVFVVLCYNSLLNRS